LISTLSAVVISLSLVLSCLASEKPNVLLISIDTLRADHLGCYGNTSARTPVIDQLAREGVRFERAFSTVPLTLPAHASILTGTYPSYHGIRDNAGFILPQDQTTLAEVLRDEGYSTGAVVGAYVLDSKFGLDQGFDHYFDNFDLSRYENISPGYIQRTGDKVVDEAVRWLNEVGETPFFLWVHLYDPHDPYTPPEPYASRHPGRPYDGEIEFTDGNVGALLDALKKQGAYENTLIVLAGDHGESLGEHGEEKHGFFVYNATLHVPLIFRLPQGREAGRIVGENVSLVDLFPTVLQWLELSRSNSFSYQGIGLSSLLLGKGRVNRTDLMAECYYPYQQFGWSPLRTLISGRYKFVQAPAPELYDLSTDFAEGKDLASEEGALTRSFRQRLEELENRYQPLTGADQAKREIDSETAEKLRSLGYLSLAAPSFDSIDISGLKDPKDEIALYNKILRLFILSSEEKYREAIPEYQQILSSQPGLKIVRYKLGQALFHTGSYEQALDQFKQVIDSQAGESLAVFDLAQTYLKLGRVDDASLGFQRTIQMDPGHYRARTNLGVLYKNQGKLDEAVEELEQAISVAPNSVFALSNLGVTYSMKQQHDKAVRTLEKAFELAPENAAVCANLAVAFQRKGDESSAQKYFEIARRLDPRLFKK
jgi:arylsulfatase A-like enzyme/Flp pilus assembly protein TadD